ncbi:MAG: methylated-DNA--[Clostridia bacterium]|nr:methylated-DNA--[protein]-cysteine S-methyltransferase [Clostridia bacterium]
MIYKSIFSSPLGYLELCSDGGEAITRAYFTSAPSAEYTQNTLTETAAKQLGEYFEGKRRSFDVPLSPEGTEFEKQVWMACAQIPYGEARTYKELAIAIGDDKAARKVGQAVDANPIVLFIPTHRVKGKASLLAALGAEYAINEALYGAEVNYKKKQP